MVATRNRLRARAVAVSRSFKVLLVPGENARAWGRMALALAGFLLAGPTRWRACCYRAVFRVEGGALRGAAEHVLADLREFCFARTSAFDPDPIIMARRQGRRDVWLRITNYLNLDEAQVQKLMEIDNGEW